MLNSLSNHYLEDKIDFYYISKKYKLIIYNSNLIYSEIFDEIDTFPTVVVIKPKKARYA